MENPSPFLNFMHRMSPLQFAENVRKHVHRELLCPLQQFERLAQIERSAQFPDQWFPFGRVRNDYTSRAGVNRLEGIRCLLERLPQADGRRNGTATDSKFIFRQHIQQSVVSFSLVRADRIVHVFLPVKEVVAEVLRYQAGVREVNDSAFSAASVLIEDPFRSLLRQPNLAQSFRQACQIDDVHAPEVSLSMPVTPARGLCNRVNAREGSNGRPKTDIYSGLDQLGTDADRWLALIKTLLQFIQNLQPVGRAHACTEVRHSNASSPCPALVKDRKCFALSVGNNQATPGSVGLANGQVRGFTMLPIA